MSRYLRMSIAFMIIQSASLTRHTYITEVFALIYFDLLSTHTCKYVCVFVGVTNVKHDLFHLNDL